MSRQFASLFNKGAKYVPPHFVSAEVRKVGTEVRCDCPVHWSSPNICQHALAAAEDLSILAKFLQWVHKTKKSSNLLLLIADSVPKTVGEKSTARRKGAPKKKQSDKQDITIPSPSPSSFNSFMYSTLMQSKKQSIRVRPNSQMANVEAAHKKKDKWRDNKEKSEYNKVKFYLVHVQRSCYH